VRSRKQQFKGGSSKEGGRKAVAVVRMGWGGLQSLLENLLPELH